MFKTFQADKDTYITNKVVQGSRVTGSNVGDAGTLDLFKLYGASMSGSTPNTELSRILIHFDIGSIKELHSLKKIDVNDASFWCKIRLKDVYGGQSTPSNFTIQVHPLSASFEEGIGRDVTYYSDRDRCNWASSSYASAWFTPGCTKDVGATTPGDYITSSVSIASTQATQFFKTGDEDLLIDVTQLVSSTVSGELPDVGFRISFENELEANNRSYFVKRFGSRTAFDESKRPILTMGFDDSVRDDTQNLTFDTPCRLSLYNYFAGEQKNILSGSTLTEVKGDNCLLLRLMTNVSGGQYELAFTGSQTSLGSGSHCYVSGGYFADVILPSSDSILKSKLLVSSSVVFTPIWSSLDKSVGYVTGSDVTAYPPTRSNSRPSVNYYVNVKDVKESYASNEMTQFRVEIFDRNSPYIKVVKVPVELPGVVLKSVHYQVRNSVTNEVVVPFDRIKNSTKISSDSMGMFFDFDASALTPGQTYVFDISIERNGVIKTYQSASPSFRIG